MENKRKMTAFDWIFVIYLLACLVFVVFALSQVKKSPDFDLCREKGGIPIPNWSGVELSRCDLIPFSND